MPAGIIESLYPLSPMQQGILFHTLYSPRSGVYFEQLRCRLEGGLDVPAFRRAWQQVVDRHPILRTGFDWEELDQPFQVVLGEAELPFTVHDWRQLDATEQRQQLEELCRRDREEGFDLAKPPLMRLIAVRTAEDCYEIVWSHHHLLLDGWSIGNLFAEVFSLYEPQRLGQPAELPPRAPYSHFINWLQQRDAVAEERFWRRYLAGFRAPTPLAVRGGPSPSPRDGGADELRVRLAPELGPALLRRAREQRLTLSILLQAAWALLLSRYSGETDVVFGLTTAGRPAELPGVESMLGVFVNTVPARFLVPAAAPLAAWLQEVRGRQLELLQHEHSSLTDVQGWSEVPRGVALFATLLGINNYPVTRSLLRYAGSLRVGDVRFVEKTGFPLTVDVYPEGELSLRFLYEPPDFEADAVARLAGHFAALLEEIAAAGGERRLAELDLLTAAERHQLVAEWNDSATELALDVCVHELFAQQALRTPRAPAVCCGAEELCYGDLDRWADLVARSLIEAGIGPGSIVALLAGRGIPLLVAILAIWKAGGAYLPLDPQHPPARWRQALAQSGAGHLLVDAATGARLPAFAAAQRPRVLALPAIVAPPPAIAPPPAASQPPRRATPGDLAYVFYTSGSTGVPKGAMIEHRGLLNHLHSKIDALDLSARDVIAQTASQCFDISVWQLLTALALGGRVHIVAGEAQQDPARLLDEVRDGGVTVLEVVPSVLRLLLEELEDEPRRGADLAGLRWLIATGEALPPELCRRWLAVLPSVPLLNAYGPTECSDDVAHQRIDVAPGDGEEQMAIGRPVRNTQLYALDAALRSQPLGVVGELYVGGTGVGRGYLDDPERTATAFLPDPFSRAAGARLYRTGDLSRLRRDGSIDFLGRSDHQVKVRGFRIELGEIETQLARHPAVAAAAVAAVAGGVAGAETRLVAYVVSAAGQAFEPQRLRDLLAASLPDAMVPSSFVQLQALPLSPNGKLDRQALPAPPAGETAAAERRGPENLLAGVVAAIWSEVLGLAQIDGRASFFEFGGHSLTATRIIARLRRACGVELPLGELFEHPTLAAFTHRVAQALEAQAGLAPAPPLAPAPRGGRLPLSFAQERLWFLDQLQPGLPVYNIPVALRLVGPLDVEALAWSLDEVVARHEALRVTFSAADGVPFQVIAASAARGLPVVDLTALPATAGAEAARRLAAAHARRPFDLARGPLLRAALVRCRGESVLLVAMHHTVSDGWSMGILLRELAALYLARCEGQPNPLPPQALQYADFACWQRQWMRAEVVEEELVFWRRQLAGAPPLLAIPTDRPRPPIQSFRGARLQPRLSPDLAAALERLSRDHGVTLFMSLLTAYLVLLYRYSGQDDLCVGTPVAGRNLVETEDLIGFFVNTLILRVRLAAGMEVGDLLARVREAALAAHTHQNLPFERLVDEIAPQRSLDRTPLFQVMFVHQAAEGGPTRWGDLELLPLAAETGTAKFDLNLSLAEGEQGIGGFFEYSTDLFDGATARRMLGHYVALAAGAAASPERRLADLDLLEGAERAQILREWNDTAAEPMPGGAIHHLFEAQARRLAAAAAVVSAEETLSYDELNRRANRLARQLRALGVRRGTLVGIYLRRSARMATALLAVLKAGGAYVPLEPGWPADRVGWIVDDLRLAVVVTQASCLESLAGWTGEAAGRGLPADVVVLDARGEEAPSGAPAFAQGGMRRWWEDDLAGWPEEDLGALAGAQDLAYVIFTSGSTGRPKGVVVRHGPVMNLISWVAGRFGIGRRDRVLFVTALSFDLSVYDLFGLLGSGGSVRVASDEEVKDPERLAQVLWEEPITFWDSAPAALQQAVPFLASARRGAARSRLRLAFLSGDWVPLNLAARLRAECGTEIEVVALGGATEAVVWSNFHPIGEVPAGWVSIPYGHPIANAWYHVLDGQGAPCPLGVPGDLYIGGGCLAAGYAGEAALTAARFVPDPFGPRPGGRLYRTGDRARYRGDGSLEFLGRLDSQVKIRGFRIELGEIEAVLAEHPAVHEVVALARPDDSGHLRLAVYATVEPPGTATPAELRRHLARQLPEHMVPAAVTLLASLPLTANGKVDRQALALLAPAAAPRREGGFVAPRTPREAALAGVWTEVLRLDAVSVHDNFFELGGDSILSIQMISRAARAGLQLTPRMIFQHQTIAALAAFAAIAAELAGAQQEVIGEVPLAPIQRWLFEQELPALHHFNQAILLAVLRPLQPSLLALSLEALLSHHDALRGRFERTSSGWRQRFAPPGGDVPLHLLDLAAVPAERRPAALAAAAAALQGSLDLGRGPLLRAAYCPSEDGRGDRLLLVAHHLVVDGVSWRILVEDLLTAHEQLSQGRPLALPPKTSSYRSWTESQERRAGAPEAADELPYWLAEGRLKVAPVPVDALGGTDLAASSRTLNTALDEDTTRALLYELPRAYRARIDDLLLTALASALSPWLHSRRLLVDVEGHGRGPFTDDLDLSRTVGWFTTLYPLYLELPQAADPPAILRSVKEQLRRVPGQGVGYGLLRYGRSSPELRALPQAEVSFNYLGHLDQALPPDSGLALAAEPIGELRDRRQPRRYRLEATASIVGGRLRLAWEYSTERHRPATVERLARRFAAALEELVALCRAGVAAGFTPADFPLARLDQETLDRVAAAHLDLADLYTLSPLQQGILFHALEEPTAGHYIQQLCCTLRGALDPGALALAWQGAVDRQSVLRTAFLWQGLEEPHQWVGRQVAMPVRRLDWRGLPAATQSELLVDLLRLDRHQGFELTRPPLVRLYLAEIGEGRHQLVFSHHHLLLDGWSLPVLFEEVFALYEAGGSSADAELGDPHPYSGYIAWLRGRDLLAADAFWRRALSGFQTPTPLALDRAPAGGAPRPAERTRLLAAGATARLNAFARQHQLTLNTLAQAAWGLLLRRYSGEPDVVFGAVSSGRSVPLAGIETMIGLFINTLPVRVQAAGDEPPLPWLAALQAQQAEARQFEHAPLVEIQRWSEVPRGRPLFESILVFENYPVDAALWQRGAGLEVTEVHSVEQSHYALSLSLAVGRELLLRVRYDDRRIDGPTAERLLGHLLALLADLVAGPPATLDALAMLSLAERHQLLVEAADTARVAPGRPCLHQLFEAQAERQPEAIALTSEAGELTYGELESRGNQLAHYLRRCGVGPEALVGICAERGPDLVVAMLAVLKAGGAYVPLDPTHPPAHLARIAARLGAVTILAGTGVALPPLPAEVVALDAVRAEIARQPTSRPACRVGEDNAAYVIHTSGSTGEPKGVVVAHGAIRNRILWSQEVFPLAACDRVLQGARCGFDFSVWEIFAPLAAGARVVLPRPGGEADSAYLAGLITEREITVAHFVPSLLRAMLDEAGFASAGSLSRVYAGGEALDVDLARRFASRMGAELVNQYGPTEAAVDATFWRCGRDPARVAIGRPIANTRVLLLSPDAAPVPVGVPGEIHIAGGLARGYLGRPDLTAERFVPDAWGHALGGRLYRTGDLARLLPDGEIQFLGRRDHQVKVRGIRVELGEIEAAICRHEAVREAAVVLAEEPPSGGARVAAFLVARGAPAADPALRNFLATELPLALLPASWEWLPALPRTPAGKVDRRALAQAAAPGARRQEGGAAPRGQLEELLAGIWSEVLDRPRVLADESFFDLGGHSLMATRIVSRLRDALGVELPLARLFESPTVAGLAREVERAMRQGAPPLAPPLAPAPRGGRLPLSFSQQRLWFLDLLEPGTATYNVPSGLLLVGPLDVAALACSLTEEARRHEVLRTVFPEELGEAVQVVLPPAPVPMPVVDLAALPAAVRPAELRRLAIAEARRPFDLVAGPVLRACLVRQGAQEHALLITLHHIVCDGWSTGILVRETAELYEALRAGLPSPLPEPALQYADFSFWQRGWLTGEVLEAEIAYWRQRLADYPPVLDLPADRSRPTVLSYRGARQLLRLPSALSAALAELSRRAGTTLFMTLLGAFQALLSRYSGQLDLCIGTVVAGRNRLETEGMIGFLVNTLVLRAQLEPGLDFHTFLRQVREVSLAAHAHQELPFEKLVEELQPERSLSRTPLFQVMFSLDAVPRWPPRLGELLASPLEVGSNAAKFDLELLLTAAEDQLVGLAEYATDLFDGATIDRLLRHYAVLLAGVAAHPEEPLERLPLLGPEERHQLAIEWNDTAAAAASPALFSRLFAEQAARSPAAVAAICAGRRQSYAELAASAAAAARRLLASGAAPGEIAGVLAVRGLDLLALLLGLLDTGVVFLPLDPQHPVRRLKGTLARSGARWLIAQRSFAPVVAEVTAAPAATEAPRVLWLEDLLAAPGAEEAAPAGEPCAAAGAGLRAEHEAAYIIYTSGSTGVPKGAVVEQGGMLNHLRAKISALALHADDVVAQSASQCFDISIWQFLAALLIGGRVQILGDEVVQDPALLLAEVEQGGITILELVPTLLRAALDELAHAGAARPRLDSLRWMIPTGEALPRDLCHQWLAECPGALLMNAYGPTECSDDVSHQVIAAAPAGAAPSAPIGRPVPNLRLYVVDAGGEVVPIGVGGELAVAGAGVGRGYLHEPALTAAAFVPDTFAADGAAGGRLYLTGDLARWRSDGSLEFLGRLDHQVKIRGFRIELGEIEAVLRAHAAVREAAVLARDEGGHQRLVAYVVVETSPQAPGAAGDTAFGGIELDKVEQWHTVFDEVYRQGRVAERDAAINLRVWMDSFTGQPLPEAEILECVEDSVARILALRPERVLEIGCGTGLLLERIAPHCRSYCGTDLSAEVLAGLAERLAARQLPEVTLLARAADDLRDIPERAYDVVILNEVVQYFPSADYLARVVEGLLERVCAGGYLFIGGVRNWALLEAFHASVQMHQGDGALAVGELRRRTRSHLVREKELLVAPGFWSALSRRLPRISGLCLELKGGRARNELTRFRYDVTLQVEGRASAPAPPPAKIRWLDWQSVGGSLDAVRRRLAASPREPLAVAGVPNARLGEEERLLELLREDSGVETTTEVRRALRGAPEASRTIAAVDPADVWALASELGLSVEVRWSDLGPTCFDAVFRPPGAPPVAGLPAPPRRPARAADAGGPFANRPLQGLFAERLVPQLRAYLAERLPDSMLPAAFVLLESLPLTANGKLDRRALPVTEEERPQLEQALVAPRTEIETKLAALWAQALNLGQVGVHDNFFELGGDSILSIQIVARARAAGLALTPRQIFQFQTVAELAAAASAAAVAGETAAPEPSGAPVPLTPIQRDFFTTETIDLHHYNQSVLLATRRLSPGLLARAVSHLGRHHDALRMRFERTAEGWQQAAAAAGSSLSVAHLDLAALPAGRRREALEMAAAALQQSLDLAAGPLGRFASFDLGDSEAGRLLAVLHHLIVDGVSWRILLEDLEAAVDQLEQGAAVLLPAVTASPRQWVAALAAAAERPEIRAQAAYWLDAARREVAALPVDEPGGEETESTARSLSLALGAAETRSLLQQVPRAYHTQINDALLTALALAVADWTGGSRLLVDLEGHGREETVAEVDTSRTVGWFTSLFPVLLDLGAAPGPGEALKSIKEQLRAIPQRGIGYGLLRYLGSDERLAAELTALPAAEVAFNYLGQLDQAIGDSRLFAGAAESPGPARSPRQRRRYLLEVNAAVAGGRLGVRWTYSAERYREATIQRLAAAFRDRLREIIDHCRSVETASFTPSDFPLAGISQLALDRILASRPVEDLYPLSPLQAGLLFHTLDGGESGAYFQQFSCALEGALDVAAFRRAWAAVLARHPILRTAFLWEHLTEPLQAVAPAVEVPLTEEDWRQLPAAEQRRHWESELARDRELGFDLARAPLMRLRLARTADQGYRLLWSFHHLLLDGWSLPLLWREVLAAYEAGRAGRELAATRPRPFRDYIAWLRRQDLAAAEEFWRRSLAGVGSPTPLAEDRPLPVTAPRVDDYRERQVQVPPAATAQLERFARRHQLTLNTVLQGAWALLAGRHSGEDEVVFGVVTAGRPAELSGADTMLGAFINTLPARIALPAGERVAPWLEALQQAQVEMRQFEYSPLVAIHQWAGAPPGMPLFRSLLVFENYPVDRALGRAAGGLTLVEPRFFERTNYPLALTAAPGPALVLQVTYDSRSFDAASMVRRLEQLRALLAAMAEDGSRRLGDLSPLGSGERQQLLWEWNATAIPGEDEACLHDLIAAQAERTPDALAVSEGARELTYRQLEERANRLARHLIRRGVGLEARVAVCLPRSLDLAVTLLAVLKAGGAYVALDPAYPGERLRYMLRDSRAVAVVTTGTLVERLGGGPGAGGSSPAPILCPDRDEELIAAESASRPRTAVAPGNLAYVLYTSGSTGEPKGVAVSHSGVVNYLRWATRAYDVAAGRGAPVHSSIGFDLTVTSLFSPWLAGRAVFLLPEDRGLDALGEALVRGGPFSLVKLTPAHLAALAGALPRDEVAGRVGTLVVGGEALSAEQVAFWREGRGAPRVVNEYGPTETVVGCCIHEMAAGECATGAVPIGRPIANTALYLLDRHLRPVPLGAPGVLYIGGAGVARGYEGRPAITAERFIPDPWGSRPGGRLYCSGDLVRQRPSGEIEFLGRADAQLKIQGNRVEPGEVEAALLRHPQVWEAAVVAWGEGASRRLACYFVAVPGEPPGAAELRRFLQDSLPEPLVPAAFVRLAAMPWNAHGKLDRRALPAPGERESLAAGSGSGEATTAGVAAPRRLPGDSLTAQLASIWSEVLGVGEIGLDEDFFALGGHSLLATQVISRVRAAFQVELPLRSLFEHSTVERLGSCLAAALRDSGQVAAPPITPVPRDRPLPASFAQRRLWFLCQLAPESAQFNIPIALRFRGRLDVSALRRSLAALVRRHEALRTCFAEADGEPLQVIAAEAAVPLAVVDLGGLGPRVQQELTAVLIRQATERPFRLDRAPLLRALVLRSGADEHVAVLVMHHLVSDGWSLRVLVRELSALYGAARPSAAASSGAELPPGLLPALPVQYVDFAAWQRQWLRGEALEAELAYWQGRLAGAPARLELPFGRPRPAVASHRGAARSCTFAREIGLRTRDLCRVEGVTLFMALTAAFLVLLHGDSGADDLVVGTDVANRNRLETEELIGFFVNQLVLRASLAGDPDFRTVLARVREAMLGAFTHQDLPFEMLVERLRPERSLSYTPLFQVKINLQNLPPAALELPGLELAPLEVEVTTAQLDLVVEAVETAAGLMIFCRYSSDLFTEAEIDAMMRRFEKTLDLVTRRPDLRLAELGQRLAQAERTQQQDQRQRFRQARRDLLARAKSLPPEERGD
jgi:amino acid adenylation domain-containing protein/non-ribosomal peptide synthase protein (TIGR01720 family)